MRRLDNQVRFIMAVLEDRLLLKKRKLDDVVADLVRMNFDRLAPEARVYAHDDEEDEDEGASFSYLLKMPLVRLTLEEVERLEREYVKQQQHVAEVERTTPQEMWLKDLQELRTVIDPRV